MNNSQLSSREDVILNLNVNAPFIPPVTNENYKEVKEQLENHALKAKRNSKVTKKEKVVEPPSGSQGDIFEQSDGDGSPPKKDKKVSKRSKSRQSNSKQRKVILHEDQDRPILKNMENKTERADKKTYSRQAASRSKQDSEKRAESSLDARHLVSFSNPPREQRPFYNKKGEYQPKYAFRHQTLEKVEEPKKSPMTQERKKRGKNDYMKIPEVNSKLMTQFIGKARAR